jgi:hypothetical protein
MTLVGRGRGFGGPRSVTSGPILAVAVGDDRDLNEPARHERRTNGRPHGPGLVEVALVDRVEAAEEREVAEVDKARYDIAEVVARRFEQGRDVAERLLGLLLDRGPDERAGCRIEPALARQEDPVADLQRRRVRSGGGGCCGGGDCCLSSCNEA